jgi:hypothetical protein
MWLELHKCCGDVCSGLAQYEALGQHSVVLRVEIADCAFETERWWLDAKVCHFGMSD